MHIWKKQTKCMDICKISKSAVGRGFPTIVLQVKGPQCPFGLVFTPWRGGEASESLASGAVVGR